MKYLKRLDKGIGKIETFLIVFFLWTMVLFTFVHVCLRALYTHANLQWANSLMGYLDWSESLVRLLVLWLAFLGASLLTGENKHIKIDIFSTILPRKWLPFRELLLSVSAMGISGFMVKLCVDYVKLEAEFGGRLFLDIPAWTGQLIMPAGFALICFRFFLRAFEIVLELPAKVTR